MQADFLDQLAREIDIGVVANRNVELVGRPVTTLVLHRAKLAERDGEQRPAVMAQLDRAQAEAFHRAHIFPAADIFADAEGIIEQVKDA